MARSEARLQFGLWRAGLDGLGPHAKLVYAVLLTEPTLNHAGVGAIRMSRWAKDASLTIAELEKALGELTASRHVVLDEDTEEVLVRTLIRNDGVAAQPFVLKGALKEALMATSSRIRWALAEELRKLPPQQPDGVSKAGKKVVYPDPHAAVAELVRTTPEPPPEPSRKGSETLFDGDPSETLFEGFSSNPSETLRGGGRGGGVVTSVGSSVGRSAASQATHATKPETVNQTAQRLAKVHFDTHPMVPFMGVMKICKRALENGYAEQAIAEGLVRLGAAKRSVSLDSLRIELDGPPLRLASGGSHRAWVNPSEDAYDLPMFPQEGQ